MPFPLRFDIKSGVSLKMASATQTAYTDAAATVPATLPLTIQHGSTVYFPDSIGLTEVSVTVTDLAGTLVWADRVMPGNRTAGARVKVDLTDAQRTAAILASADSLVAGVYSPVPVLRPTKAPTLRRKLADIRGNIGSMKLLCGGDSTTWGAGNQVSGWSNSKAYPGVLSSLLNSYVVPTQETLFLAPSSISGSGHLTTTDPRWTAGAGWILSTQGFGTGSAWQAPNGIVTDLVLTPGNGSVDTFDIYYARTGITGQFTAKIDAGSTTQFGGSGANAILKATVTGSAGSSHTMTITPSGNGAIFILYVEAYSSTFKGIRLGNAGVSSSTSTNWANVGAPYNGLGSISAWAPNLSIIMHGINDARQAFSVATHTANMTAIGDAAAASGDVILMSCIPSDPTDATYGANTALYQPQYAAADAALAAAKGWGYLDVYGRFVSYSAANTGGYMYDKFHANGPGYADIAGLVFNEMRRAA